jgi:hypothetical protein
LPEPVPDSFEAEQNSETKDMSDDMPSWPEIGAIAAQGWWHHLQAAIVTGILVEIVGAQVPDFPQFAMGALFLFSLTHYGAAAARSAGLGQGNAIALSISRTGALIELVGVGILLLLVGLAGSIAIVALGGGEVALIAEAIGFGVLVLFLVARLWPLWVIAFYVEGEIRWSAAARGSFWAGPGLGAAWRLTRTDPFGAETRGFLAGVLLLAGMSLVMRFVLNLDGLAILLLYLIGLPLLSQYSLAATTRLLAKGEVNLD